MYSCSGGDFSPYCIPLGQFHKGTVVWCHKDGHSIKRGNLFAILHTFRCSWNYLVGLEKEIYFNFEHSFNCKK